MTPEQHNFIDRLNQFFNQDWEKGKLNDREEIKETLGHELEDL